MYQANRIRVLELTVVNNILDTRCVAHFILTSTIANAMDPLPSTITSDRIEAAAGRVMQRCERLAEFSESADNLTRTFCCPPMHDVHREIFCWMQAANMEPHVDALGNIVGRQRHGIDDRAFMFGSHLDTIAGAGKYDGTLGVLLGLAVAELVQETGMQLTFSLEVAGFSEEEGVRFNTPYLGSAAIAGKFDAALLDINDREGVSVRQALLSFGSDANFGNASHADRKLIGFIEAHIEQGPVLESQGCPVGVVSAIAGQTRATMEFCGSAGHAGTVPHGQRLDSLAAAAEFIIQVEQQGNSTNGLVATVGRIDVEPNVSNVIPGKTTICLDVRHEIDSIREAAVASLYKSAAAIADRRDLKCIMETNLAAQAVKMDDRLSSILLDNIRSTGNEPHRLPSGAGHDAAIMATLAPAAMLFVRCRGGISHHPDEFVAVADVTVALKILFNTLMQISNN